MHYVAVAAVVGRYLSMQGPCVVHRGSLDLVVRCHLRLHVTRLVRSFGNWLGQEWCLFEFNFHIYEICAIQLPSGLVEVRMRYNLRYT